LVVTIVLALLGAAIGTNLVNVPTNLPSDVPGLDAILSISGILALLSRSSEAPSAAPGAPAPAAGVRNRGFSQAYSSGKVSSVRGYRSEASVGKER
jgi:hypothetical protein